MSTWREEATPVLRDRQALKDLLDLRALTALPDLKDPKALRVYPEKPGLKVSRDLRD